MSNPITVTPCRCQDCDECINAFLDYVEQELDRNPCLTYHPDRGLSHGYACPDYHACEAAHAAP